MFGQFQQSNIRFEVKASGKTIQSSLTQPHQLTQWLWMQRWGSMPVTLEVGKEFTTYLGNIPVTHRIDTVNDNGIRFILSQGIDGFHEWSWDDGWIQSRLEGVSLLPLNFGQTIGLLSLRHFVELKEAEAQA
ncbi:MAG: hypothetical protein WBB82_03490 [Limnothrix sp.]